MRSRPSIRRCGDEDGLAQSVVHQIGVNGERSGGHGLARNEHDHVVKFAFNRFLIPFLLNSVMVCRMALACLVRVPVVQVLHPIQPPEGSVRRTLNRLE